MAPNSIEADQYLAIANRFFHAYNETDIETIDGLVSEDVCFEHHNRSVKGQGKQQLLDQIQGLSRAIPGRSFAEPIRWAARGEFIFIEHVAYGTPMVDIEIFGWKKGDKVENATCSILVFKDGKIHEWHDYA